MIFLSAVSKQMAAPTETNLGAAPCATDVAKRLEAEKPTPEQIARFIEIHDRLSRFEGEHRWLRRWGAFSPEECAAFPDEAVVAVTKWLIALSEATSRVRAESDAHGTAADGAQR